LVVEQSRALMGCWKFPRGPEAASGEPSAIANWWGRTLGATPLLFVLALERIAAHNSRRPTGEFPVEVAQNPL
jgi:hypothetical protein